MNFEPAPRIGATAGDDDTVDAFAEERVDMPGLALRIVGAVAHEDRDAGVRKMLLQPLHDRDRETAEVVAGDQPDSESLATMQTLGEIIRPKTEALATAMTLSRVSCLRLPPLFRAFETVPILTPAARATSWIVTGVRAMRLRSAPASSPRRLRGARSLITSPRRSGSPRRSTSAEADRKECRGSPRSLRQPATTPNPCRRCSSPGAPLASTSGSVNVEPRFMITKAARNSFHDVMNAKSETVTIAGRIAGR